MPHTPLTALNLELYRTIIVVTVERQEGQLRLLRYLIIRQRLIWFLAGNATRMPFFDVATTCVIIAIFLLFYLPNESP